MEENNKQEIIRSAEPIQLTNYKTKLQDSEKEFHLFLARYGLPADGIFVEIPERIKILKNIYEVLELIPISEKEQSVYLSKFIAAVASGLFDAALNYLWNETIQQIRKRVVQYDLEYFYNNVGVNVERREKLKDESHLVDVGDHDLIKGSKEIGLISEIGFKNLAHINYMRNWASAAHPNQNSITGYQLLAWFDTCVKEVIRLPISNVTIGIKKLLVNIKSNAISEKEAREITSLTRKLTTEQINNLASGFFGIYIKPDTDSQTHQNINRLLPLIWNRVEEDFRLSFGLKYANFKVNGSKTESKLARQFLELVNAESYIPEDLRSIEIETAIENLLNAHRAQDNFYSEPPLATQLLRIVGQPLKVPLVVNKPFVLAIVETFLTNGFGVAKAASPIYEKILSIFDSNQANIAVLSFSDDIISSRLQIPLCQKKFKEMVRILKPSITSPPVKDIIQKIENFEGDVSKLMDDRSIRKNIEGLKKIL